MGYALLGHGGLELEEGGYPEGMGVVAIDAGTTLQVYTDTGQSLHVSKGEYEIFSKLQTPWAPMDSTNVTYNLELSENETDLRLEDDEPGFFARCVAPHTPLLAGRDLSSPALLCTGDPTTCPTDPRMITGQVAGPTAHTCDGILGQYKGELLWVACTVVYSGTPEDGSVIESALGVAPESVLIGQNPDDPSATWYYFEANFPAQLDEWFDEQNDTVRQALLADDHIYEWNSVRPDDFFEQPGPGNY